MNANLARTAGFVFATAIAFTAAPSSARADEWMVRRQSMGAVCHVQLRSASPLGGDLSGPFSSRKAACLDAKAKYDDTLGTVPNRCSTYGSGTVTGCKSDSVPLPGQ